MSEAPHRGLAIDEHAGRPCPYCRFAIKAGVDVVTCGECGAVHHADCWDDNAGCSIMGCAAAPAEGANTSMASTTLNSHVRRRRGDAAGRFPGAGSMLLLRLRG